MEHCNSISISSAKLWRISSLTFSMSSFCFMFSHFTSFNWDSNSFCSNFFCCMTLSSFSFSLWSFAIASWSLSPAKHFTCHASSKKCKPDNFTKTIHSNHEIQNANTYLLCSPLSTFLRVRFFRLSIFLDLQPILPPERLLYLSVLLQILVSAAFPSFSALLPFQPASTCGIQQVSFARRVWCTQIVRHASDRHTVLREMQSYGRNWHRIISWNLQQNVSFKLGSSISSVAMFSRSASSEQPRKRRLHTMTTKQEYLPSVSPFLASCLTPFPSVFATNFLPPFPSVPNAFEVLLIFVLVLEFCPGHSNCTSWNTTTSKV